MKIIIITLILSFAFIFKKVASKESLKCENEGCYEVIKTFAKLLEEKINETDKILAEAEKELNEVTFGDNENFQNKINEIDHKLTMLIIDLNTGIEGGEHTLFDLINTVFKAVNQAEENVNQLEISIETGNKLMKVAELEFTDVNDIIRQVQEQFNKLQNETETDLPKALQDAFDKSDKFHTETKELNEILDKMKSALKEYENNLLNAKDLTSQAIEKFSATSKQIDETEKLEEEIKKLLDEAVKWKLPNYEFFNMKKLSTDAAEEANSVFEEALELLNEVSLLELNSKLDDIKTYVMNLENYSTETEKNLKKFAEENEKFLSELEETIDTADEIKQKALEQMNELKDLMDDVKSIEDTATKAILNKDEIINSAKEIYKTLEDFTLKVEESHEMAKRAFEKIPEIQKKITESVEIVEKLENKLNENEKAAAEVKEKCTNAKNDMNEVLKESEDIKKRIDEVADELDDMFENMKTANTDAEQISNQIDRLKKFEGETEIIVDAVQEKIERTSMRVKRVDENVTKALEDIQSLVKKVEDFRSIDEKSLNELEGKLDDIDYEIEDTKLIEKINKLKAQQQEQNDMIAKYKMEIAVLEHQIKEIKANADSLEEKCFKRTRLEP
ncbi:hypothetical protein PVAND_007859 [Polypedilum vanderplanki]|uniref:Uncharacterized protein n=1 Tax=Polypedilum vanderplanki TaxID=319348 RepID=A0A9J6C942_POLVA|nr:hypothetical protein PVAND_007859 [Polypedilum vanderplanki]